MKILVVRFSSLGDVVLATAAARFLKERRKGCRLVFLTKPEFAGLLKNHPDLDEAWAYGPGIMGRIKAAGFDAVLDLHGSLRSRALGLVLGLPLARVKTYALNRRLRVWFKKFKGAEAPQVVERGVEAAARLLGEAFPAKAPEPRMGVQPEAARWASKFKGRLIAMAPGAAHATKRWPESYFAELIKGLPPGSQPLLLGSPSERALCQRIAALAPKSRARVLAGETDLPKLAALISRCRAFVGNDSGPTHLANALGVKSLVFFGPTIRAFGFYPRGRAQVLETDLDCRPCHVHGLEACPLGHHDCMVSLKPKAALSALKAFHA